MVDTLSSVLIGGAAGLVSAVLTHFSTRARIRLDRASEYDKELQASRLAAYKALWGMLEPLSRYGRNQRVTPGKWGPGWRNSGLAWSQTGFHFSEEARHCPL